MTDGTIHATHVRKIYETRTDRIEAVAGVSFTAKKGEFIAILGPSGCGKSTLLMMCAGLETITEGSILLDGRPVTGPRPTTGIMFQDSTLLPWKTVLDNVLFPAKIQGRDMAKARRHAQELIELVGLKGFEGKRPHELSGGMRQRTAICRALVTDPDILLMDEPFSALDAITRDEMNEALLAIWETQVKTALFVTHSIREAVFLADRVLVMTRRPARIVEDLAIPFARPRPPGIQESVEFNRICGHLRGLIEPPRPGRAAPAPVPEMAAE